MVVGLRGKRFPMLSTVAAVTAMQLKIQRFAWFFSTMLRTM